MVTRSLPLSPASCFSQSRLWRTPARERLSNTWTLASVVVSRRSAQFEPTNPAPPKMSASLLVFIAHFSCREAVAVELSRCFRRAVFRRLRPQPLDQFLDAFRKTLLRFVAERASRRGDIRKAMPDVAGAILPCDLGLLLAAEGVCQRSCDFA